MNASKRKFCPVPFQEFRLSTTGDLSLCSPSRLKIPVVGNIVRDGIEGAWNSERAVELRRSILDGSFRHCMAEHCPALQKKSLPSANTISNAKFRDIIDNDRTILPEGPTNLNLHYDVTCNLKCPTCRPAIIGLKGKDLDRVLMLKDMLLKSTLLDGAKSLTLCGYGDPFASRPHLEFLRGLDARRFRDLRITLLTNGILLTPKMWDTFPDAHPLIEEIAISIDAASAKTYALNRGGNFDRLLENLSFIGQLRRRAQIRLFRLNFVVQANNFREMPKFVRLGHAVGADRVVFQKLANSNNAFMKDYSGRAVHLSAHPEHQAFRALLKEDIFTDPIADLYTISDQATASDSDETEKDLTRIPAAVSRVAKSDISPHKTSEVSFSSHQAATEIAALSRENEELHKDCEALKRALAIFGRMERQ